MLFKTKVTRTLLIKGEYKDVSEIYLTDSFNIVYAIQTVINTLGRDIEIEEIQMLKNYKPAVNDFTDGNKVYIIKVAEDIKQDTGDIKTFKYPMPVFANNDSELYSIVKNFLSQGLSNMRLTTISETKWIYIK